MEQQQSDSTTTVRKTFKTFKYNLMPTPNQAWALERVVWRCRTLYNAALEERKTAWDRCHVSVTYFQQKAELPDLKAACPDYAEVNAQVLHYVVLRVERAFQACLRRLKAGEEPGAGGSGLSGAESLPLLHLSAVWGSWRRGAGRQRAQCYLSKIGRLPIRLHRPLAGIPKAAWAGKRVEAVPPAYTSQDCSGCGKRLHKSLSVRTHVCTNCGLILDRDETAALHIHWAGQALRGLVGMPAGMNRCAASTSGREDGQHTAGGEEPVGAHPCLHVCPSCGLVMDRDENAAQHMRRAGQARQAPTWVDTPSAA
jgi:predicted RNA-binding Zn-ribbon protein involved in translation (DUF1610 family)